MPPFCALRTDANCPVIILGEPVNNPQQTVKNLRVSGLFIDGNRYRQQRELWRLQGEGSEIRNNGITVQNVSDSVGGARDLRPLPFRRPGHHAWMCGG